MTDLTVLVSPIPLYPETKEFTFCRRPVRPLTPIMVTLETEIDEEAEKKADQEADREASKAKSPINDMDFISPPTTPRRRTRTPTIVDSNLLSPPANTWRSRPRHRPTRSQSTPPERRLPAPSQDVRILEFNNLEGDSSAIALGRALKRSSTPTLLSRPITRGGELVRPPPPLFRPTTFWRKTRRSGVTGASYSPSSHLIRRSTYIAAGLAFDAPIHDLSALCVESRVGFIVIPSDQL